MKGLASPHALTTLRLAVLYLRPPTTRDTEINAEEHRPPGVEAKLVLLVVRDRK